MDFSDFWCDFLDIFFWCVWVGFLFNVTWVSFLNLLEFAFLWFRIRCLMFLVLLTAFELQGIPMVLWLSFG